MSDYYERYKSYLKTVGECNFQKIARLDFLYPDGTVNFSLSNKAGKEFYRKAFIQDGTLSCNMQNGQRRTANVKIDNQYGTFSFEPNKIWFGQQVKLYEGIILPDGTDFYLPQGVFYISNPSEMYSPDERTVTLKLVDKWSYLDGTLFGNLDGIYEVPVGTNIYAAIKSILAMDRGNGYAVDNMAPVFTDYYNGKTQTLTDGTTAKLTDTPSTLRVDSDNGTYADMIELLNGVVVGEIGYDVNGHLRIEPSTDDTEDLDKPILWDFSENGKTFLGADYSIKNGECYNDVIVVGAAQDDYAQPSGRATNYNSASGLSVYGALGRRTYRTENSSYYTDAQCQSYADWYLRRQCILKKSVTVTSTQLMHLQENRLVTIKRSDKDGSPIERHLITGFSRPIGQTGTMSISCTSVEDYATA